MEYVRVGKTGLKVSRICLGMMSYGSKDWMGWMLPYEEALPFIRRAIEAGINFFDTADIYSLGVSEEILGRALRELKVKREDVVIATKVFFPMGKGPNDGGLSRKHIMEAIDGSLKRLGMDYVDLYQIHRFDKETPIEETMEALHDVVKAGKARYIGGSSMFAWQFVKMNAVAERRGWTKFVSMQNQYSLVYREEEREMIPYCNSEGIGLLPWSPLAGGFLTGKRKPAAPKPEEATEGAKAEESKEGTLRMTTSTWEGVYDSPEAFEIQDRVVQVAERMKVKPAQVALAWVLSKPGVASPIVGVTKLYQLEDALAALSVKLSEEDVKFLEEPYKPRDLIGFS